MFKTYPLQNNTAENFSDLLKKSVMHDFQQFSNHEDHHHHHKHSPRRRKSTSALDTPKPAYESKEVMSDQTHKNTLNRHDTPSNFLLEQSTDLTSDIHQEMSANYHHHEQSRSLMNRFNPSILLSMGVCFLSFIIYRIYNSYQFQQIASNFDADLTKPQISIDDFNFNVSKNLFVFSDEKLNSYFRAFESIQSTPPQEISYDFSRLFLKSKTHSFLTYFNSIPNKLSSQVCLKNTMSILKSSFSNPQFNLVVSLDQLYLVLDQLLENQKVVISSPELSFALQKVKLLKYSGEMDHFICIDYNFPNQFYPKSSKGVLDFIGSRLKDDHVLTIQSNQELIPLSPQGQSYDVYFNRYIQLGNDIVVADMIRNYNCTVDYHHIFQSIANGYSRLMLILIDSFDSSDYRKEQLLLSFLAVAIRHGQFDLMDDIKTHSSFKNRLDSPVDDNPFFSYAPAFNPLLEAVYRRDLNIIDRLKTQFKDFETSDYPESLLQQFRFPGFSDSHMHAHKFSISLSALHVAVFFRMYDVIESLLQFSSDHLLKDQFSTFSPLHIAIELNDIHSVRLLLKHSSPEHLSIRLHSMSLYYYLSKKRSDSILKLLIEHNQAQHWHLYSYESLYNDLKISSNIDGLYDLITTDFSNFSDDIDSFKFMLRHLTLSFDQLTDISNFIKKDKKLHHFEPLIDSFLLNNADYKKS